MYPEGTYFTVDLSNWDDEIAVDDVRLEIFRLQDERIARREEECTIVPPAEQLGNALDNLYIQSRIQDALKNLDVNEIEKQVKHGVTQQIAAQIVAEHLRPKPKELKFMSRAELLALPKPASLLGGCLQQDTLAILLGKFGSLKSMVALDWALTLSTGGTWNEIHKAPKAYPALYVAAEGHTGLIKRMNAWERHYKKTVTDDMFRLAPMAADLTTDGNVIALTQQVREFGAKLLVIDTLHKCCPGIEENSATEMGAVVGRLNKLRADTGCTVLMVHHTGHVGTRARGSSSIEDDVDTSWIISFASDAEERNPEAVRLLKHRKSKDSEYAPEVALQFQKIDGTDSGVLKFSDATEAKLATGVEKLSEVMTDVQEVLDAGLTGAGWRRIQTFFRNQGREVTKHYADKIADELK